MVDVALNWPGVSPQRECLSPMMRPNISIPFRLVFITQFLRECLSPMIKNLFFSEVCSQTEQNRFYFHCLLFKRQVNDIIVLKQKDIICKM